MSSATRAELIKQTVARISEACPRLIRACYWAGTSAIALEELGHRESFDLDFHTQEPLLDTRPFLAEVERAFPDSLELISAPDAGGSGFTASITLSGNEKLALQVFAGFEPVPDADLVQSSTAPKLRRITLHRYLADKVQCVVERLEGRDLVDIAAVLRRHPRLERTLRIAIRGQDALVLAERLSGWTDASLTEDLRAYADVNPADAIAMRDRMVEIVRDEANR